MADSGQLIDRRFFAQAAGAVWAGTLLPAELFAQDAGSALRSELLMDVVFDVATPHNLGSRMIVPVTGGTFTGPKLKGTALSNGGDWIMRRADGASLLNVRATLKTDDDQLIYMTYDGIMYTPPGGKPSDMYLADDAAVRNRVTEIRVDHPPGRRRRGRSHAGQGRVSRISDPLRSQPHLLFYGGLTDIRRRRRAPACRPEEDLGAHLLAAAQVWRRLSRQNRRRPSPQFGPQIASSDCVDDKKGIRCNDHLRRRHGQRLG